MMGYPSYTNPKFPIDFIVGDYLEHAATPSPLGVGETVTIVGSLPTGLTYDSGTNKIKGVATTVADSDFSVEVYNGITLIAIHPYTIVVLELDITFSGGASFAAYTVRTDTFSYSVTGSYTPDTPYFSDAGSILPEGLVFIPGYAPSFALFAKEAGRFKAEINVVDAAGHSFTKIIPFTVTTGTPSGSQLPTLDYTGSVAELTGQFSQHFTAKEGNSNYSFYSSLVSSLNVGTGYFTKNPTTSFHISVVDKPYEIGNVSTGIEVVDLLGKPSITLQKQQVTPNIYSWATTYDGSTYRLYAVIPHDLTKVASITSTDRMWALSDRQDTDSSDTKKGFTYVITGYHANGDPAYNDWVIHEVNETTKAESTTITFQLKDPTLVTGLVRPRSTGPMIILTDFNGDGVNNSPPQRFYPSTGVVSATSLPADKKYVSGCFATSAGTEYAYLLNVTDSTLVRYNPVADTYSTYTITDGLFNGQCSRDKVIYYFDDFNNAEYILVTDSGKDLIYSVTLTGTVATWKTLATGAKPSGLFSDNRLVFVLQQGLNNILSLDKSGTVINTTNLNRWYNRIALPAAPETTVTYRAVGPIKPGTVSIEYSTTDLGKLTSTDSAGVMSAVGDGASGTVDYCSGVIVVHYPTTTITSSTPYLTYENTPNTLVGYNEPTSVSRPYQSVVSHNSEFVSIEGNVNHQFISTVSGYGLDHISTTELVADTVTPVSDRTTITWGVTARVPSAKAVLSGSLPPGLTFTYPDVDLSHFKIAGTCTTPGVYVFTVKVQASAPA